MAFKFSDEDLVDREVLGAKLMDLASIVFTRHYYASFREREDLISVGVLKCLSLINDGGWNKSKGPLFNYLYSGVRNEMHNYLYRINRDVCMDEFFDNASEESTTHDEYFEDELLSIDYSIIEVVMKDFPMYGNLNLSVCRELSDRGLVINNYVQCKDDSQKVIKEYGNDFFIDLIDRLVGAVLWKNQAYYH